MRRTSLIVAAAVALLAPASASALGISIPASGTLSGLAPGQTATASGIPLTVTGVVFPWSVSVTAESSPTPGRMRATGAGCANSASALTSPLTLLASTSLLTTTIDRSSTTTGTSPTQIAHGTATDVLSLGYQQPVSAAEALVSGCAYQITLTFTVS